MNVFLKLVIVFCIFMLIKNEITCRNHKKIINATRDYSEDVQNPYEFSSIVENMENYETTLFRLWDFGCKNILPKEDYELIKPYIK